MLKPLNYFLIFITLLIAGCSSTDPRSYAADKQFGRAYDFVIFRLDNNKNDKEKMITLTKEYPEIIDYGYSTFSIENLKAWAPMDNIMAYRRYSLQYFCVIASEDQCKTATENLAAVEKTIKKKLTVPKDLYDQLTPKEQQKLSEEYRLSFYQSSEIGIVTDRQFRTINSPGSNTGAEIGGAVGAATYINKATPSNYSMKNDLGSTAAGALVGALLLNKNPTTQYITTYTIKLRNGEVTTLEEVANKPIGQGVGICVRKAVMAAIDQSFCTMTIDEFRMKYSYDLKD